MVARIATPGRLMLTIQVPACQMLGPTLTRPFALVELTFLVMRYWRALAAIASATSLERTKLR